jgi:hypothetical protein
MSGRTSLHGLAAAPSTTVADHFVKTQPPGVLFAGIFVSLVAALVLALFIVRGARQNRRTPTPTDS